MTTSTQSPPRVIDLTREEPAEPRRHVRTKSDFERLYAEFVPRVRGLVRKLVTDADLVDDLVQETFLRAYHGGLHREYRKAHPEHTQWPWLAAVARNLSLDVLRRRKIVVEHELEDHDVLSEAAADDPEVCLLATRRRESIHEALATVSERHRRILVAKVIEGKRYEDIAAEEGISVEALKSVLARARRTFRASYATIAQRRGLGVLVGGGVLRGVSARVRSLRDRIAPGFQEGLANLAASAPAAVNAMVTAVVLGSLAAMGALIGAPGRSAPPPALSRPVSQVSDLAASRPAPAPDLDAAPAPAAPEPVAPAPDPVAPASASSPPPPPVAEQVGPTEVDTDDVVPVENPPGGAEAKVEKSEDEDGYKRIDRKLGLDTDGDGETDTGQTGTTKIDCGPDMTSMTLTVVCAVLDTTEDATGA